MSKRSAMCHVISEAFVNIISWGRNSLKSSKTFWFLCLSSYPITVDNQSAKQILNQLLVRFIKGMGVGKKPIDGHWDTLAWTYWEGWRTRSSDCAGFLDGSDGKETNAGETRHRFNSWAGKILLEEKQQPWVPILAWKSPIVWGKSGKAIVRRSWEWAQLSD